MNESDRRQRVISSTPRLSTDEIVNHSFAKGVRGFSETEVRTFLRRVSEELALARGREQELESAIDALEEQVRTPRSLSEQELLDALGEETARLLRSAREASDEIRKKAEDRAARLVEDATAAAERTRAEAADLLATRTAEAEAKKDELIAHGEAKAAAAIGAAQSEAEAIVEQARRQGHEMLDEAKAARERVLGDLVRRRALLSGQIEALRNGRDRLLDAYRTVKGTFLQATEALAQVEARAAAERSTSISEPVDIAAEIAAEIDKLDEGLATGAGAADAPGETESGDASGSDEVVAGAPTDGDSDAEVATALADVDSLFARLRAGHDEVAAVGPDVDVAASGARAIAVVEGATPAHAPGAAEATPVRPPVATTTPGGPRFSDDEWRTRRGKAIDPLLPMLVKRAKRRAQDDQNSLLDSVRRHKGRPTSEQVLGEADAARDAWGEVLRETIDRSYRAGRTAAGGASEAVPADVVAEVADAVALPLRERLVLAIDSGVEGDAGGLVERIGARYREWKNQTLEATISETLATAWNRGVYDAVSDDAVLWWVPFATGRCSDCDDNALEPTVKGKQFPTGQALPPAHPGCKCLLVPAEMLAGK
jgi:DivIVA domain-containing protein